MKTTPAEDAAKDTGKGVASAGTNRVRVFFNGFAVGVLATAVVAWFLVQQTRNHPDAQARFQQATDQATNAAGEALYHASEALKAKMETLDLKPDQVQEELARTGTIMRRRARELAGQVADVALDARTTAAIKAKLAADSELSVWRISVSTTDGRVTLDGKVSAAGQVAKAVALAIDTDRVRDVTSTLKVDVATPPQLK